MVMSLVNVYTMAGAKAAEKKEVICADEVLVINPGTNQLLLQGDTRKRIQAALAERIAAEERAGTLPFKVKQAGSYEYEGVVSEVDAQVRKLRRHESMGELTCLLAKSVELVGELCCPVALHAHLERKHVVTKSVVQLLGYATALFLESADAHLGLATLATHPVID